MATTSKPQSKVKGLYLTIVVLLLFGVIGAVIVLSSSSPEPLEGSGVYVSQEQNFNQQVQSPYVSKNVTNVITTSGDAFTALIDTTGGFMNLFLILTIAYWGFVLLFKNN